MEKEKGCSTAYLDSSPTVLVALTELGEGAEPLVEVLKEGLDKLPTTQSLVRTHPSLTGPGIAIRCVKCNYHWLCVLTLVIFGTIAQLDADKTVSVARAPA